MTNKFGTWGVGSKGVSEDWDDDFDFGENGIIGASNPTGDREEKRIDSGVAMRIPQTIRDQQAKVVSNIGLVREFGLLIEELKVLRARVGELGLLGSSKSSLWQEMDAMIDLADQEVDDPILPPKQSPPASPTPDFDGFDDMSEAPSTFRTKQATTPVPSRSRSRRRSVLPADSDVFSTPKSQATSAYEPTPSPAVPLGSRPRKDSEALARSVIEALQQRNDVPATGLTLQPVPPHKKVPFDTNTLRHIVPYVNSLVKRVKESVKEALDDIEEFKEPDSVSSGRQPLSQLFKEPAKQNSPSRNPRESTSTDDGHDSDDLDSQMNTMNLT
jgi:hypothetical protein